MFKRGGIYLANLNPAKGFEPGKTRPVLVVQSDLLNSTEHKTVVVLPLTSQLVDEAFPLRFTINKQDNLNCCVIKLGLLIKKDYKQRCWCN